MHTQNLSGSISKAFPHSPLKAVVWISPTLAIPRLSYWPFAVYTRGSRHLRRSRAAPLSRVPASESIQAPLTKDVARVAYKQQTIIAYSSEGCKSKVKVPEQSGSGESCLSIS